VNAQSKFEGDSASEQSEKDNVSAVKALKDYLIVRAPFDGVITERNVSPGTLTGPNFKLEDKPLLNLQDNKKLRLEVFIPEEYVYKVDMSDNQIDFSTDALPGQIFHAPIARSSDALNNAYRSEAIEADVMNKDNTFKPGMYVEAILKVKSQVQSFIVPSSAIITSTERKYVVAVENGKAEYVNVTQGITDRGRTEVFGHLHEDETILRKPADEIKDGDAIDVAE
jgi:RND family efflux transporter MFP subunit